MCFSTHISHFLEFLWQVIQIGKPILDLLYTIVSITVKFMILGNVKEAKT